MSISPLPPRPSSRRFPTVALLRFAVVVVASAVVVSLATPATAASYGSATDEWRVLTLTNQQRANAGCPPLKMDSRLVTAARRHSLDMATQNYFSHTSKDGRTPWARMSAAGYPGGGSAENIAAGQKTPEQVVSAWMNSPGHRANIVNCSLRALGVGLAVGGQYGYYWTQDFGTVVSSPASPPAAPVYPLRHYVANGFGGSSAASFALGLRGDRPFACDFNGDGKDTIGVFRRGTFYLRNNLGAGPNVTFTFGQAGDLPICGDWNGDGRKTIGIYRPSNSTFYLRNANSAGLSETRVVLGIRGDIPVAGDWNGDGKASVGIYRSSTATFYVVNSNSSTSARTSRTFGLRGDRPVVGDYAGNGRDTLGVRRGGTFYLTMSFGGPVAKTFAFGAATDIPMSGDWDGNRVNTVGVAR